MFLSGADIPGGAELETDICIVRRGTCWHRTARELGGGDLRDPGPGRRRLDSDREAGPLYEGLPGENAEFSPYRLRHQQVGGTANLWGISLGTTDRLCRYTPFDEIDFEPRAWHPHTGWPISKADLDPYYERASRVCGLGPYRYDGADWAGPDFPLLNFPRGRVTTTVFQFGLRDQFTSRFRKLVAGSREITVVHDARALELETDHTSVRRVRAGTLGGCRFGVRAKVVILAAGGIEILACCCCRTECRRGLGNTHDLVGRYFTDHSMVHSGHLFPHDRGLFDRTGFTTFASRPVR